MAPRACNSRRSKNSPAIGRRITTGANARRNSTLCHNSSPKSMAWTFTLSMFVPNRQTRCLSLSPVGDNERQRVCLFGTNMDKVNVHAIDFGDELWQSVELRLAFAPVVIRRPIAGEFLDRRELHALGAIAY